MLDNLIAIYPLHTIAFIFLTILFVSSVGEYFKAIGLNKKKILGNIFSANSMMLFKSSNKYKKYL